MEVPDYIERVGCKPARYYIEMDLVLRVEPIHRTLSAYVPYRDADNETRSGQLPDCLVAKLDVNYEHAKTALIGSLWELGVPVLETEVLFGEYSSAYRGEVMRRAGLDLSDFEPGESIENRFWQVIFSPATQVCPPPTKLPPSEVCGRSDVYSLDYRFASLILRTPGMSTKNLSRENDNWFYLKHLRADAATCWRGRAATNKRCTYDEIRFVLYHLRLWCKDDVGTGVGALGPGNNDYNKMADKGKGKEEEIPDNRDKNAIDEDDGGGTHTTRPRRIFTIVVPEDGDPSEKDIGTNTGLRVLLMCDTLDEFAVALTMPTPTPHNSVGVTPLDHLKRLTMLMWFFEYHMQSLCPLRQVLRREQSDLFPYWSRNGPLARMMSHWTDAAVKGAEDTKTMEGNLLVNLRKYAPPSLGHEMQEFKKLGNIWGANDPRVLQDKLRLVDSVPRIPPEFPNPPALWPVFGFFGICVLGQDGYVANEACVSIGGLSSMPLDLVHFRAAAQLASCLVDASLLPRKEYQKLLHYIHKSSIHSSMEVIDRIGANADVWRVIAASF